MGIPFTLPMGFLFTPTMGKLFTMTMGIQLTVSTLLCSDPHENPIRLLASYYIVDNLNKRR